MPRPRRHATPPKNGVLFEPGKSGNPGGFTKVMRDAKEAARGMLIEHVPAALQVIINVANSPLAKDRDRITAAQYIVDQVIGKPVQAISGDSDGSPIQITGLTVSFVSPKPDSRVSGEA